ncbi:serine hydrolase domain-containing protein [Tomitella gaofuii]|uniref:serine hydrolase domain-containing protein n=1 Tax=Tomitella gaofuii TaxID=2760083 RepID=UPI0015F98665|nr:serine hydrolase domain-containing protein [Tomitella gaofuii]
MTESTSAVQGACAGRFEPIRAALEENFRQGTELGASIFVDIDGERVVDLWGGYRNAKRTLPWEENTIVNVWSTTKTVTCLAALMLVDRGLIDLNAPVSRYWPEFAANGKEKVEIRHFLAHTSGVSGWEQPFTTEDMYDWESAITLLAAQAPWWEPGTASGYHAHNQGHLIGEIIRRVTGKSLKEFVATEISGPLGADFQIGASDRDRGRIAEIVPPPPLPLELDTLDADSPMLKTFTGPPANAEAANTDAWRRADMGALNGHGNARSVARIMSAITSGGTVDGNRLLSQSTIDLIFDEQSNGTDLVLGMPLRRGIGYALPLPETIPFIPEGKICFWGGWGGSQIVMDLDRRVTFSYMMNKMGPGILGSDRTEQYIDTFYRILNEA